MGQIPPALFYLWYSTIKFLQGQRSIKPFWRGVGIGRHIIITYRVGSTPGSRTGILLLAVMVSSCLTQRALIGSRGL